MFKFQANIKTFLEFLVRQFLVFLGCVSLSKAVSEICSDISSCLLIDNCFCWTDSEVAVCWIKGKRKSWTFWIENRVLTVRKVVDR